MRPLATRPSAARAPLPRRSRPGTERRVPGRRPRTARRPAGHGWDGRCADGLPAEASCLDHRPDQGIARRVLGAERDYVAEARVQFLAAGQAPWPVNHLAVAAADPEPSRVLHAVDADLHGAGLDA